MAKASGTFEVKLAPQKPDSKEAEAAKVNVRTRGKEKTEDMSAEEFAERIRNLILDKSSTLG